MITNNLSANTFVNDLITTGVRPTNLADYMGSNKKDNTAPFTEIYKPTEGMYNLEPVERYKYILNQTLSTPLKLQSEDAEKTIKEANELLNKAMLPPSTDNPGNAEVTMAMIMKKLAQSRLDITA